MTLDEYFEKTEARKLLVNNLKVNMDVFEINAEQKDSLLRVNLIMVRQCMEDEGVE